MIVYFVDSQKHSHEYFLKIHKMFGCNEGGCKKSYKSQKALEHHKKQCHAPESLRTCSICGIGFGSVVSRKRHEDSCSSKQSFVPRTQIVRETIRNRHVHVSVKLSSKAEEIMKELITWMKEGEWASILKGHKRVLSDKTINTYAAHLRSFVHFLEEAKTDKEDLILSATTLKPYKEFLSFLRQSSYGPKTIANRIFAMQRFVGFLTVSISAMREKRLTSSIANNASARNLNEVYEFLQGESAAISPEANRATLVRNCRQVLEADGKWESLPTLINKFDAAKPRLEALLDDLSTAKERPLITLIYDVQDYVLLHLVLYRPTMRSQNFVLQILPSPQNPRDANSNGIFIPEEGAVILQLSKYKTATRYGFLEYYLSDEQSEIIRKFVAARKWIFPNPEKPTHDFLFCDHNSTPLLSVGKYFKRISYSLFDKNISISTIRKIMESTLSEGSDLNTTIRNALSAAMLHDPATARRYYVSVDMVRHSNEINNVWEKFITKQRPAQNSVSNVGGGESAESFPSTPSPRNPEDVFSPPPLSPSTNCEWSPPHSNSPSIASSSGDYYYSNVRNNDNFDRTYDSPPTYPLRSRFSSHPYQNPNSYNNHPTYSSSYQPCFPYVGVSPSHINCSLSPPPPPPSPPLPSPLPLPTPYASMARSFPSPYYFPYSPPPSFSPPIVHKQPGLREIEGDWVCRACCNYNFRHRIFCKACNVSKFNC